MVHQALNVNCVHPGADRKMTEDHKYNKCFEQICVDFRNFEVYLEIGNYLNQLVNLHYSAYPQ